jgi:hypothetical protein
MKREVRTAFNKLKKLGCPVRESKPIHHDRGYFWIDAEVPEAELWLNYWSADLFFGSDKLNKILAEHNLYWEWYNSAYGCVYDA